MQWRIALNHDLLDDVRKKFPEELAERIRYELLELAAGLLMPGHKLEKLKNGFWSLRLNKDLRLILSYQEDTLVPLYVDHHDKAYEWAERHRVEFHPKTQEFQVVRVKIEERPIIKKVEIQAPLAHYPKEYLHDLGIPWHYVDALRLADLDRVLDLASELGPLVQERILSLLENKPVPLPPKVNVKDRFLHPSNRYRFLLIESKEELEKALFSDWEDWMVFLHPIQRVVVEQDYRGPAKVTGAAGTGKTVVAIHRAVRLAKENSKKRILLTTYTRTLADTLREGASRLGGKLENLEVEHFDRLLTYWYTRVLGKKLTIAKDEQIKAALDQAKREVGAPEWASDLFLLNEWSRVVDAWGIRTLEEYLAVDRTGRGTPLNQARRRELWPVFERTRELLTSKGLETWGGRTRTLLENLDKLPRYDHVVVDETQDLSPIQLKLLRAVVPEGENDLFLVGDAAQRIYQTRVPWRRLGIETVGRSQRLWINYRTTKEIAEFAEKVLPERVTEAEGEEVTPKALSVLSGEPPQVQVFQDPNGEITALAHWLRVLAEQGYAPEEIAIVARTRWLLKQRGEQAAKRAGLPHWYLEEREGESGVRLATMHRVKGLEFRAVAVIGVEDGIVPLKTALNQAETEADRDAQLELERQLLFVALSRAREKLWASGVGARSPFLPAPPLS